MPTYEYKCDNGHKYVEIRAITEDSTVTTCKKPNCSLDLKRVFSAPPVTFKGTGFSSTRG
jgi:putative FmdB family regulatory protein